jgi:hypothetical protein
MGRMGSACVVPFVGHEGGATENGSSIREDLGKTDSNGCSIGGLKPR